MDWRCLVLRLFEPSDDPAHPRVVDDLLAYRGMQRAFEARSDYRGCRDMEAYCDEYDPDRAYHGRMARSPSLARGTTTTQPGSVTPERRRPHSPVGCVFCWR